MEYRFKLINSLEKVFFDWPEELPSLTRGSMLKNEAIPFSWLDGRADTAGRG